MNGATERYRARGACRGTLGNTAVAGKMDIHANDEAMVRPVNTFRLRGDVMLGASSSLTVHAGSQRGREHPRRTLLHRTSR